MLVNSLSLPSNLFTSFSASDIRTNQRWPPLKSSNSLSFSSKSRFLCKSTQNSSGVGPDDAVIIVDHGSRRKESNLMLNEFVEMYRRKTGYQIVEPAHMELAEPSIGDAFQSCVQQGVHRIIISPFFLGPGRHWSQDIPSLSAEAAKQHPGVSYIVTAPLGLHELLVDVVNDRINYCLKHVAGDADECSVCAGTGKCILHQ
uniref:Sirohydrochlorin ferrochelatase n=1 Tax=Medicago truncatula TaxID=3880 RepID=I3SXK2_MEDTR|nr:unknown [Medicago truncatula]